MRIKKTDLFSEKRNVNIVEQNQNLKKISETAVKYKQKNLWRGGRVG
jgi:hypothetical protein